ncbi:MAG: hypothetical protein NC192_10630, partial [Muribaculaceae bacterium]|nr:hypothetical protein [Muribaculaceae bacterium]
ATLAEHREKAVIKLPEERRKGTKYQVIRGQYLRQANKKENANNKNTAAKQEEKQEKAKRQTMAAMSVKDEKEKDRTSTHKSVSRKNETAGSSETKDEYAKSANADRYAERMQTNIDLSKAVNIPPPVAWEQVIDHAAKKDSVYDKGGSAQERALQYKEKANFYLNKMKKNSETGQKEVNPNRDKDIGDLYKKAYKLAHKEELLDKKNDTAFDKAQSAMQLKSEIDNALDKDSAGEAAVAVAAIPFVHAAKKATQKLAGKTGLEIAAKVTEGVAAADGVGETTVNAVLAAPKYAVQKKVEKTVQQVMQNSHDRKIAAQRERLRQKQEKVEKRAQEMRKENMQRKMKAELYKSEHGITSNGNNILKNAKAALKNALEAMKRAISVFKSSATLLMAAAGGSLLPILLVGIVIIIVLIFVLFPFIYTSSDGTEDSVNDSKFVETVPHYYEVMDGVVDKANNEIQNFQNSYVPKPCHQFHGFKWVSADRTIPKGRLYDEILCTISTYNQKLMTRPETANNGGNSGVVFMNDKNVADVYGGAGFWEFTYVEVHWSCGAENCSGHYRIDMTLTLNFNLNNVWNSFNFDEEDKETYEEVKKEFDKEKENAGIT